MVNSSAFSRLLLRRWLPRTEIPAEFPSIEIYLEVLNFVDNTPRGLQSDQCINELFKSCKTSYFCRRVENAEIPSFGYSATHKLLYHLIRHHECRNTDFYEISQKLCSRIHFEMMFTSAYLDFEFKDLFMEQLFLCTFVGFDDFMRNDWISKVLKWQLNSGCFSYDTSSCSTHMNGLGIAALSFFGYELDNI